jgi:hypothetical protein
VRPSGHRDGGGGEIRSKCSLSFARLSNVQYPLRMRKTFDLALMQIHKVYIPFKAVHHEEVSLPHPGDGELYFSTDPPGSRRPDRPATELRHHRERDEDFPPHRPGLVGQGQPSNAAAPH